MSLPLVARMHRLASMIRAPQKRLRYLLDGQSLASGISSWAIP